MLAVTKAGAYVWTDDSGVTWTFFQRTYIIGGEEQQLWAITGVSGYSENVVVPEKVVRTDRVYDSTTRQYVDVNEEVTIEAIGNYGGSGFAFTGSGDPRNITAVTLPATIKYIGYGAFGFYAGTVTMKGSTPPVLGANSSYPNFSAGITILVPAGSLETYQTADGWTDYAVRVVSQSAKTSYDVSVVAQANGSGLHSAIGEENLGNVMSLKVKGTINSYDIMIMRNKMHNLHHLDLTNASVVANTYEYYKTYYTTDNAIGDYAFYIMKKLMTVKLPKTITAIGQYAMPFMAATACGQWSFKTAWRVLVNMRSVTVIACRE